MKTSHGKLLALALISASIGCGVEGDDTLDRNVAPKQGAISGGQLETGYPMVGAILAHAASDPPEGHLCTGAIISDSWVLTAQHCEGTGMVFRRGNSIWGGYVEHTVDLQVRHPNRDQMLIHLATPIPGGIPILKINEGAAPAVGTVCTGVGFGENTAPGAPSGNGIKRSATMQVQFVEPDTLTVKAVSGLSAGGDSGGPLICNGLIAGTVKGHIELDGDYPARQTSIYRVVDAPWVMSTISPVYQDLNLLNGWTQYGTRNASYALVNGRVHLKGSIMTSGTNAVAFSLPTGFRPDQNATVAVDLYGGAKGSLLINKNGQVTVQSAGAFSVAANFTSLEGVSFVPSFYGYANLVLKNGWLGGTGTSSPGAAEIGGVVRLRGAMQTTGNNMDAFQLPTNLRPANNLYLPIALANGKKGRLFISSGGDATVVPESTADAKTMTSLDGVWFAKDSTGFSNIALQNGWSSYGFGTSTPAARLMFGVVHLRGAMKTGGTNSLAFTLPAALRPPVNVWVPVDVNGGRKGRLSISPTGTVNVWSETASDGPAFTSLEGVSFAVSDFSPLILENGWAYSGYGVSQPGFSVTNGVVQLKGAIGGGVNGALFKLPVAARPLATLYLPTSMCGGWRGRLIVGYDGTVTMYPQNGDLSKAQCFTGLDGISFPVSTLNATTVPPQNGWTFYGNGTRSPMVRLDNGVVRLQGAISTTAANNNSLALTLPSGFRPSSTVYVRVDLVNAKKGRLTIATDGSVYVGAEDVWRDAQSFTSLEGVAFSLNTAAAWNQTLQNGWVNYGTRPAAAVSAGGLIRLQGAVYGGTSSVLFTLPVGLRPAKDAYVPTDLVNAKNGRLYISTSGAVSVETGDGPFSNATSFTSLEGVTFPLLGN